MEISTKLRDKFTKENYYLKNVYKEDNVFIIVASNPDLDEKIIRIKKEELDLWK